MAPRRRRGRSVFVLRAALSKGLEGEVLMRGQRAAKVGAFLLLGAWGAMLSLGAGCDMMKSGSSKKAFNEACVKDTDCESGECATYGSICSKSCTYDKDCGGDLVCRVKDVGTGNQCSRPAGKAPGATATCVNASECQHAKCLKRAEDPAGAGVCSKYCEDAAECPAGMKLCATISDSGALKLCLPGDEKTAATASTTFTAPKPVTTVIKTDAGAPTDAGTTTPTDAGMMPAPTDAGTTPKDAGTPTPTDAGTTPTDAGRTRPIIKLPTPTGN